MVVSSDDFDVNPESTSFPFDLLNPLPKMCQAEEKKWNATCGGYLEILGKEIIWVSEE